MAAIQIQARLSPATVARMDAVAEAVRARMPGVEYGRSDVVRGMAEVALPVLEQRYGITPPAEQPRLPFAEPSPEQPGLPFAEPSQAEATPPSSAPRAEHRQAEASLPVAKPKRSSKPKAPAAKGKPAKRAATKPKASTRRR